MPKAKAVYTRIYACSIRFIEACGLSKKSLYKVANLANLSLGGVYRKSMQSKGKQMYNLLFTSRIYKYLSHFCCVAS